MDNLSGSRICFLGRRRGKIADERFLAETLPEIPLRVVVYRAFHRDYRAFRLSSSEMDLAVSSVDAACSDTNIYRVRRQLRIALPPRTTLAKGLIAYCRASVAAGHPEAEEGIGREQFGARILGDLGMKNWFVGAPINYERAR